MEKLKPILAQHFWILFVVVMCLPIVGWWGATAGLKTEANAMIDKVNNAFNSVSYGENIPNDSWDDNVTPYIKRQEERNEEALEACWEQQVPLMKWPATLRVPDEFYGEFETRYRNIYRAEYPLEVERVFEVVDPYDREVGEGTILFDMARFPHRTFGLLAPSSQEMWEAQQDLWLFESLFKAIRKVNEGSTIVTESAIRSIEEIRLVGGSGEPDVEQTAGTGGGDDEDPMYSGTSMSPTRRGGSTGVAFDPASELGPPDDPNTGQGDGDDDMYEDDYAGPGGRNQVEDGLRYVGSQEGGTYLKRGFYLEVVMQHSRVSDLLIELSNADYPVAIKRFQFASNTGGSGRGYSSGAMPTSSSFDYDDDEENYDYPGTTGSDGPGFGRNNSRREVIGERSFSTRKGRSQNIEQAALASGQLVRVAICGEMVLYNPPPQPEAEETATTEVPPEPEEGTTEPGPDGTAESVDAPMSGNEAAPGNEKNTEDNGTNGSDPASESKNDNSETTKLPVADPLESAPKVPSSSEAKTEQDDQPASSENTEGANN